MRPTRIEPKNMPVSTVEGMSALLPPMAGSASVRPDIVAGQAEEAATKRTAGMQTAASAMSRRRLPKIVRPASTSQAASAPDAARIWSAVCRIRE